MSRFFMELCYDGTAYHGWQVQENTPVTVQAKVNEAVSKILDAPAEVTGCGRTDTGVHARQFFAHFDSEHPQLIKEPHAFAYKFNSVLPRDIVIRNVFPVPENSHARYDAESRTYEYHITTIRDPFLLDRAMFIHEVIDLGKMNEACKILFNYKDFSCFSKSHTQVTHNNCEIKKASWFSEGHQVVFTITADRFLRNMVRAIVGTFLEIGKGKIGEEDLKRILEGKNRSEAGMSVPAHGLYLTRVLYPSTIIRNE